VTATEFCGCCGRPAKRGDGYDGLFCRDCRKHTLKAGPFEERTYFAQHGKSCPLDSYPDDGPAAGPGGGK
jgi:hypothetical protein